MEVKRDHVVGTSEMLARGRRLLPPSQRCGARLSNAGSQVLVVRCVDNAKPVQRIYAVKEREKEERKNGGACACAFSSNEAEVWRRLKFRNCCSAWRVCRVGDAIGGNGVPSQGMFALQPHAAPAGAARMRLFVPRAAKQRRGR